MFDDYQKVVSRLKGMTKAGDGNWSARCPAHDDKTASLSVKIAPDDGRLLCVCHAGCSFNEIVTALGVQPRDFFKQESRVNTSQIERTYDYIDENGQLLYQAVRKHPKTFRQRRPNPNGGWEWSLNGVRRVLYKLPELIQASKDRVVFIVEGEKDVETLTSNGYVATCNPSGAGKWRAEFNEVLAGRNVVVIPDNDATGLKHAYEVADSLHGTSSTVKVLQLPNLPDKGDVTDWYSNGGSNGELETLTKATSFYEGVSPNFTLASEMPQNAASVAPPNQGGSVAVNDAEAVREAKRLVRGIEEIMRRSAMVESDPSGFTYMAIGIMEELRGGKEIK